MHGFTEDEWIGYLEGSLSAAGREVFEFHLKVCGSCARRHGRLGALREALLGAGERMRTGVDTSAERVARVHSAVLARLRVDSRAGRRLPVVQSIQVLRGRLGPMCGTESAERVIRLAARRCVARDVGELTHEHWPAFVTHLGSILAAFCGASPARNIVGVARRLGMEDAA